MKRFPDREELVAAYWQKLTSTIERGEVQPHAKTQAMNGRLRSRPRLGVQQRPAALRHRKRQSEIRGPIRQHAQLHSHS
jgi:hypothetical protein